jgi:hypothetical protein
MPRQKTTVTLHHPDANRTYESPPSAVEFWESKGWQRADAPAPKAALTAKTTEKKES